MTDVPSGMDAEIIQLRPSMNEEERKAFVMKFFEHLTSGTFVAAIFDQNAYHVFVKTASDEDTRDLVEKLRRYVDG